MMNNNLSPSMVFYLLLYLFQNSMKNRKNSRKSSSFKQKYSSYIDLIAFLLTNSLSFSCILLYYMNDFSIFCNQHLKSYRRKEYSLNI